MMNTLQEQRTQMLTLPSEQMPSERSLPKQTTSHVRIIEVPELALLNKEVQKEIQAEREADAEARHQAEDRARREAQRRTAPSVRKAYEYD